ncbi:precorrin-8X methylmutase [Deinococcus maricopensis]|uniref:Sirohydrochlorin ferrochelatase., Precorrin-8X methylmutase n=1 Tax=Deinococcus maricopensis (strain DSM 21211 / LMG 22137 / NRRL B-23946 / LB-34) TaxID=709986 RepID=E8U429_DEIML|nr:precorrin-8X methylmutase [Deinococcus maricopensis]ADV65866.1 Sirohydrochlorin ferrochelatase., Precorrin-8X methylmutase [Deinococcus maricopensis DSM 21211]
MTQYGIVLAGHGSRDPDGLAQFEALAQLMRERLPDDQVFTHGYLEFAAPTIDEAVRENIRRGAREVVLVPGVLLAATHAKNDMPSELLALAREHPDVTFHYAAAMDLHPKLLQLCRERLMQAEAGSAALVRRDETCLVVVGRGTTDPDANSEVSKLARMLEEGLGYGASFVCYSGTANPGLTDGLRLAAKLGFRRLIVLPYFLFDGVLVKRVNAAAEALAQRHPELEVLRAAHLGVHPHVADVFIERAREGREGRAHMNCSLCKYRIQIVGFEEQVGQPQVGHHAHVRGLLAREGAPARKVWTPYEPHPIEAESFEIISRERDWSDVPAAHLGVMQRLVHTSGAYDIVEDVFISGGAVEAGVRALLLGRRVVTDVTMVQTGLKRALLEELQIDTWCGVHDPETHLLSQEAGITRSAAGIRRAWQKFGNDVILAIGDAPTAITETLRLIREHNWRPHLVIGLPVGFVGTRESKDALRRTLQVPRITNRGTRGGSPWAAAAVNAMLIEAKNRLVTLQALTEESSVEGVPGA